MPTTDTAQLSVRLELEETGGEWKSTYVVWSDSFPRGTNETRIEFPNQFNTRDEAIQHSLKEYGSMIGEQIGARATTR